MSNSKKIFIVAGEPSGDLHAAEMIHALKKIAPDAEYYSAGGTELAGCTDQVSDLTQIAVTGLFEVLSYLPKISGIFNELVIKINEIDPDVIIFTDFPDFNFRLAKKLKKPGRRLVYFISPQLWAWRRGRIKQVKQLFDRMLVIFPFEEEFYAGYNVDAAYVGHPIVSIVKERVFERKQRDKKRILLLPGSRKKEILFNLEVMVEAAKLLAGKVNADFAVLKHPLLDWQIFDPAEKAGIDVIESDPYSEFANTDLAIACSGTVTFELAVMGVPTIVVYKMARLSYRIIRSLVKIDTISIPNIVMNEKVFPEYIQDNAQPHSIAEKALQYLTDPEFYAGAKARLEIFRQKMKPFDTDLAARSIF